MFGLQIFDLSVSGHKVQSGLQIFSWTLLLPSFLSFLSEGKIRKKRRINVNPRGAVSKGVSGGAVSLTGHCFAMLTKGMFL